MEDDACGTCPNCVKYNKLAHPDLHFVFPIIKKKNKSKEPVCDEYIAEWRELISSTPYFNLNMWLKEMGAANQQALIYAKESNNLIKSIKENIIKNTLIIGCEENKNKFDCKYLSYGSKNNLNDICHNIFSLLRKADKYKPNLIIIEGVKKEGIGIAIMNRLIRSASYNYIGE
jgi:hypothetical protein